MRAITLTQPWATLVAIGAKRVETRSWKTNYRGRIAIHAAVGFPKWARDFTLDPLVVIHSHGLIHDNYPRGVVVATANLVNILPTDILTGGTVFDVSFPPLTAHELAFGDYSPGRFGWFLEDIQPLETPISAKGSLGLWEWKGDARSTANAK